MKNLKGNFLSLTGQTQKAIEVLDDVLKTAPEINVARYFKGLAYYRAKDFASAKTAFEEFLAHKPSPAWQAYTHYMLGDMALKNGQREEAWQQFKAGENVYGKYAPNLKMILKMRKKEI